MMLLNTEDNSIYFSNFNTFTQNPKISALVTAMDLPDPKSMEIMELLEKAAGLSPEEQEQLMEEYRDALQPKQNVLFSLKTRSHNVAGSPVTLDLSEYLIDLVEQDGECYVPLQTMTDPFMSDMYLFFVCTGDALYAFNYESTLYEEPEAKEPAEMSWEFAIFNYNELRLTLDVHYGLKEEHSISDFGSCAETIMTYLADVNLNNEYDDGKDCMLDLGINVYVMTSPSSFSCGNLVPVACRMSRQVTLIGQTSGGGSCIVLPCNSASGTIFQISGARQLATVKNGSFYNIDEGIEPDLVLTKPESFYDRPALVEYLHRMK